MGHKVHTQSVDGLWGNIKDWLRSKHGVSDKMLPHYLAYYEWKSRHRADNLFEKMLNLIVDGYQNNVECILEDDGMENIDFARLSVE